MRNITGRRCEFSQGAMAKTGISGLSVLNPTCHVEKPDSVDSTTKVSDPVFICQKWVLAGERRF